MFIGILSKNKITESGAEPLFDTYPALIGWSLRKLSNTATKSIRVRRDSDDAETDILLTNSGSLTTSSFITGGSVTLGTWASTDDVHIVKWYNQGSSGSTNEPTTVTQALQPIILSSGVVEEEGSLAASIWSSANVLTLTTIVLSDFSMFMVIKPPTLDNAINVVLGNNAAGWANVGGTLGSFNTNMIIYGASRKGAIINGKGQNIYEFYNSKVYVNNVEDTPYTSSGTLTQMQVTYLGGRFDNGSQRFGGASNDAKMQEIIIYSSDQAVNREVINSDIKTFYGTP